MTDLLNSRRTALPWTFKHLVHCTIGQCCPARMAGCIVFIRKCFLLVLKHNGMLPTVFSFSKQTLTHIEAIIDNNESFEVKKES